MSNPVGSKRYLTVVAFDMQLDDGGGEGGKPFANVAMRVVEGPETGSNLYRRFYLTEKALEASIRQLRALGWTGTKLSKAMSEGLGTRKAQAQVVTKQLDNGKVVDDVKGIYEPKARTTENAVTAENLDAFDALFVEAAAQVEAAQPLSELNKA